MVQQDSVSLSQFLDRMAEVLNRMAQILHRMAEFLDVLAHVQNNFPRKGGIIYLPDSV